MLKLTDLHVDPIAAVASDPTAAAGLTHPERLAAFLAPSLRSLGLSPASTTGEVLKASRAILDAAIDGLPRSPRTTLRLGLQAARRGVEFWESRPLDVARTPAAQERLARYRRRVASLQARLDAEGDDPLGDLRWALLVSAERLATERLFAAYLADVLQDLLAD